MKYFYMALSFIMVLLFVLLTVAFIFIPATSAVGDGALGVLYVPIIFGFGFSAWLGSRA